MKFTYPLTHGRLVRRYKRFLADIILDDGSEVVVHCTNSGSMKSLVDRCAHSSGFCCGSTVIPDWSGSSPLQTGRPGA